MSRVTEEEYKNVCEEYEQAVLVKNRVENSPEWKGAIAEYEVIKSIKPTGSSWSIKAPSFTLTEILGLLWGAVGIGMFITFWLILAEKI